MTPEYPIALPLTEPQKEFIIAFEPASQAETRLPAAFAFLIKLAMESKT